MLSADSYDFQGNATGVEVAGSDKLYFVDITSAGGQKAAVGTINGRYFEDAHVYRLVN